VDGRGGGVKLMDAVAERFAPRIPPRPKGLFAGIAVPLGAVRTNTTPAQHVSFLSQLYRFV